LLKLVELTLKTVISVIKINHIHHDSKNIPLLACYNCDTRERILIFFDRNTSNKVSNQKMLYYATSNTCASALPGKTGNIKFAFYTHCISALPEFNQMLLDFFNLFDSRLIFTLLYDSLNLVINAFSLGLLGAWFMRNEVNSAAAVGLCYTHKALVRCLLGFLFRKIMLKHWICELVGSE